MTALLRDIAALFALGLFVAMLGLWSDIVLAMV
ncbi:hypothetical protein GGQ63_000367 [Prosthecomicrobium pneumaticum]|uniref:Uncharacterized protein n=1 Tax=Prosthecomicrobium pneumaticum TaxID=81895 RepID=A0A7W9CTG3_9HYPH|nr:hypothetical protein [Prosthecomicrobium pneumaticum]